MSSLRILHIASFALALSLWTWALLSRNPVPEVVRTEIGIDWQFIFSKLLHACGYAFLTVLGGSLTTTRQGLAIVIGGMALHGALSELGQATMDLGRHGCIRDVLIDWAGIGIGSIVLLKWKSRN